MGVLRSSVRQQGQMKWMSGGREKHGGFLGFLLRRQGPSDPGNGKRHMSRQGSGDLMNACKGPQREICISGLGCWSLGHELCGD